MYLFFDTETTGLPRDYKAPVTDLHNWPRMVQIGWLLMDDDGNEHASAEHIIRPDGYTIPAEAARVHGITTERALEEGVPLDGVLDAFAGLVHEATTLVAHNLSFDERILGAEYLRAGRANLLEQKPRFCTMKTTTRLCGIPGAYGYKWPTLTELHRHLFGKAFSGAHSALADVRACARCFMELRRLSVAP